MSSVGDSIGMIWFCIICLILITAVIGEKKYANNIGWNWSLHCNSTFD